MHVTVAKEQERAPRAPEVYELARHVQEVTGDSVRTAFVDEGFTGAIAEQMAADRALHGLHHHGIELIVVKLPEAKKGFVLLPKRWVVERSFAWTGPSGRGFGVWRGTMKDSLTPWLVYIS